MLLNNLLEIISSQPSQAALKLINKYSHKGIYFRNFMKTIQQCYFQSTALKTFADKNLAIYYKRPSVPQNIMQSSNIFGQPVLEIKMMVQQAYAKGNQQKNTAFSDAIPNESFPISNQLNNNLEHCEFVAIPPYTHVILQKIDEVFCFSFRTH